MIYQFSDCHFDAEHGELRRAGEVVAMTPKALAVLQYLLMHHDRVVSHDELLEQCWPDTYVSASALTTCLRRVRQAIGQRQGGPALIQTIHRRGYRLVAPVTELETAEPPGSQAPPVLVPHPAVLAAGTTTPAPPEPVAGGPPQNDRPIRPQPPPAPEPATPPEALAASTSMTERRHLSVLWCTLDVATSPALVVDPEDHFDRLQTLRSTCEELAAQYEGHVAQAVDDGVLVYFGYPQAHEDDAQRAIRTGLALVAAFRRQAATLPSAEQLAVRVGIDTGVAMVEAVGEPGGPLVVGAPLRRVHQLSAVAQPWMVVISAATAQLVEGYFDCKPLDGSSLSEPSAPLMYAVHGESAIQTRLDVEAVRGLTPFVGREVEMALLQERWTSVQAGMGQVVLVRGGAGLGKSRLVQAWHEQVGDALAVVWACRCSPYHQHTAFYPLVEFLQRTLRQAPSAAPESPCESLEALLGHYGLSLEESVPLLAALVSLPLPAGRYAPLHLTPQRQRERTLETLVALLVARAAAAPVLFVVEDVHWADPSTLEFVELLIKQVPTVSLLLLLTCRPEFTARWESRTRLTPVTLRRLTQTQSAQMIGQVAAGKRLPAEVVRQVAEKTDGVPLFVEELTRMVLESGQLVEGADAYTLRGDLSHLTIPATLHDSLLARLDRLGMAKAVAQWGAVLGREFSYAVLEAVTSYDEAVLRQGLGQLVEAELVHPRGVTPHSRYRFKHALIQDAAYDALPRRRRQEMHRQLAEVFEARFPQLVAAEPEVLAHHYTEAGLTEQAIPYWQQAGQHALQRSAHVEAIAHLTQGLDLLTSLPKTPARRQQELELQVALAQALIASQGVAAPEAERAYTRARELCQQLCDTPQLFPVLRGLMLYYQTRGQLQTATQFGEQLLTLAQSQHESVLLLLAHHMLGMVLFWGGELASARIHHTQALAFYAPQEHQPLALRYGVDLGVASHSYLALELWQLGYPDQAIQHSQMARTLAQEVSHPYSLALALVYVAVLHQCRGEAQAAHEQAAAATTLATEQGFAYYLARGAVLHGWALAAQGRSEAGMAELRQGLAAIQTIGSNVWQPYFMGLLAEAYGGGGHPEVGLEVLAEALAIVDTTEVRFYAAELSRLKGTLLLKQTTSDVPRAEACFHQALDIARAQQAKSWELRAAISLARLWQQQGKRCEAHDLLAPVYQWFTEGFDTADLQEAKQLLDG